MREAADLVRRLRASRLFTVFIGLGLLVACAVQLKMTHARLRDAKKELDWTRARLDEKRDIVRRQQNELAQLAAGVDRVARVGTDARERAARLRRLARLEESREPETSPVEQIAVLDSGGPLVSETTAQALEELALLEGQTTAVHDTVVLLSALVEHGVPGAGTPPWSWPVSGAISSEFGSRGSPYGGGWEFHPGLDIRASAGTPVAATGAGTVMFAGWMHGYGNMVVIDHGFDLKTVYGHLSAIYADVGRQVREGDAIGAVGQTGRATGPHLHYEVRVGTAPVDPMCYLAGAGRNARPLSLTTPG